MSSSSSPLFSGLTIHRPPDLDLARRIEALLASGLPLDSGHMAELVSRNAIVTGSVLKRANNAYYGLRHTIGSITHAIDVLEPGRVAHMILETAKDVDTTPLLSELLAHARMTARVAHRLAVGAWPFEDPRPRAPGMVFTAGLMHNYGRIVLAQSFLSQAPALFASSRETVLFDTTDWRTPEQLLFGMDAAEAGEFAASRMSLPDELVAIMSTGGHATSRHPSEMSSLFLIVEVASAFATAAGYDPITSVSDTDPMTLPATDTLMESGLAHREDLESVLRTLGLARPTIHSGDRHPVAPVVATADASMTAHHSHGH